MSEDDATGRGPRRWVGGLAGVVLLAAVLRIAVVEMCPPRKIVGDELYYANVAVNVARGRGHTTSDDLPAAPFAFGVVQAFRPPAHPFLLSTVLADAHVARPWKKSEQAELIRPMLWVQVLVSTLVVAATGWLGWALFGARVGVLAAALSALDPVQIAYSHYLWSEPLFSLFVCSALAAAVAYRDRPAPAVALATGGLLGLGVLTREIAIPITGIVALWWVWLAAPAERTRAVRHAALMIAVAAAITSAWTVRNGRIFDRFVPVATIGPYALAEGNVKLEGEATLIGFKLDYQREPGELAKMDLARERARRSVAAQLPGWLVAKPLDVLRALLEPTNYIFQKLWHRAYGPVSLATVRVLVIASALFFVGVAIAAVLGFAAMEATEAREARALLLTVLGSALAVHVLANAAPRFRVPWLPILYVGAAFAVTRSRSLARLGPRARVVAAAALLVFIALGIVPFARDLPDLWMLRMPGGAR